MIRLAANLSMLFNEHAFMDRFAAAAKAGFKGVEYLFPYAYADDELRDALNKHQLEQVLFNLPPGDWDAGERGLASLPGREGEFRDSVIEGLRYAEALNCPRVHAMAGLLPEDADAATQAEHHATYIRNLHFATEEAAKVGREILIEPINTRDMPGFFLSRQAQAMAVLEEVGAENLKLQFDLYHCQIMDGNLIRHLERQFSSIGHIQVAGVPGRHEPDVGEVHYPAIFERLSALGYSGWIGCEYRPQADTRAGLGWGEVWGLTTH
ncbi:MULTISPECIES: 2-oxo-tetronate isomerase [Halomonadaceae]|jgi:2-dehydrotetronate isomerase|uniref:2-oxo-tetronate isomerase n=1 Tax=Halomonadaceae TaxID=28256 RepID=UPI0012EFDB01|nr:MULTISPECIES: 2-oxo-tetronate isomerase [Halomonas]CAD5259427.1 putative hydroxypyruvate isomerase [Halomonas sp. 59]CAD5259726.1 putative hydroxypyruvate isomerase [Halomonas sp. 113]CAD5273689.1 Putative hydroxypyruvate isomerase [Halomonas sp. I3]CAD5289007.1 putative hydroxypyruvate isomerase [Halomonas sp. 156]VXB35624.1 putative hydroxypyruvate isomerase [Halomonas titanicae]